MRLIEIPDDGIVRIPIMDGESTVGERRIDLSNFPTVDAVPVVHEKWVNAPLCGNDCCRCSNCGSWHNIHANLRGEINFKYCPDCGAKMDERR